MGDFIKDGLTKLANDIVSYGVNLDNDIAKMNEVVSYLDTMSKAGLGLGNAISALTKQKSDMITERDALVAELSSCASKLKALSDRIKEVK